jgi:hypothetical protein
LWAATQCRPRIPEGIGVVEQVDGAVVGDGELLERPGDVEPEPCRRERVVGGPRRPGEGEADSAVGQPQADGPLARSLVGPVGDPEEPTDTGVGVVDVAVDGLVVGERTVRWVGELVGRVQAQSDASG